MKLRAGLIFAAVFAAAIALTALGDPRTDLVVPPSDIIFSHKLHVKEQEIDCETCHVNIATSKAASDRNLPTMDECANCHDVEDDENCGMCHRNPEEPSAPPEVERPIVFSHEKHLAMKTPCQKCHAGIENYEVSSADYMPKMANCMSCHDADNGAEDCRKCHGDRVSMTDLHPADWREQHGDLATANGRYCASCHRTEVFCLDCHSGDNLQGSIHNLNYQYTHGLDAKSKEVDCAACHDTRAFCNDCHSGQLRMPLNHSTLAWRTRHGEAARDDPEDCAACHDNADPTCAQSGCHHEGSGHPIHDPDLGRFDMHGPWHTDRDYFCYQCHVYTGQPGIGFCGKCHGAK